ncbi:hypothetical protein NLI96_g6923 [Meripilus lineatus]|uniref:DUF6534 domain-containing protein n=1 Tax=Meripilus lineatus TaxID=2056292 RepID=A0AAD5YCI3_9APHY|nr:hypothetical protein NLI96_g6923 [Physisporinus lineatus]
MFFFDVRAAMNGVASNLGAIMLGGLFSMFFGGIVTMQVLLYYRLYPQDPKKVKAAIAVIWFLDMLHSAFVIASIWYWLVDNFGDTSIHDSIPWMASITIILTSFITFTVHCFFCHRIYTLSKKRLWIVLPIVSPICLFHPPVVDFVSASTCTLPYGLCVGFVFQIFRDSTSLIPGNSHKFTDFMVSLGLSMAVAVDMLIAIVICFFLNRRRTGFASMDGVINSITLYTVESGMITGIAAAASLIAWVTMPHNLIWLAIHFAISKLYANALLATLNARRVLRGRSQGSSDITERPMPVMFPDYSGNSRRAFSAFTFPQTRRDPGIMPTKVPVQINVEKTVECEVDGVPSVELPVIGRKSEDIVDSDDPRSSGEESHIV